MENDFEQALPNVTLCVNLCETVAPDASADGLVELLTRACHHAGFPYCERIYAGSYFCENFFLHLRDEFHDAVREICQRYEMGATLVVPIAGQAFLERITQRLLDVLARYSDVYDEVVVNDVGRFADLSAWIHESGAPHRLGLGRLFSKELRDARYAEMIGTVARPALSAEAQACLAMQQASQPGVRALVEVDPTSAIVDVSSLGDSLVSDSQLVEGLQAPEVAIHLPYCYATTGRNCGPASIDEPESQKFRLGRGCSQHCLRMKQGSLTDEGVRYVKHGRTYYFENPACRIAGVDSWRIVYADMGDYA